MSDDPKVITKTSKNAVPKAPKPASPLIVHDLISINTQELEIFLEEEQEFYEAVEEFEHNVGVNESMVDWFNMNFESSFVNTGEFAKRKPVVIQSGNCEDCKSSSSIFDKQRELLLKQDKQIQESFLIQKDKNEEIKKLKSMSKSLESRLEETTNMLETVLEETTSEITTLRAEPKTKSSFQNIPATKNNDIEVSIEKCKVCGYASKSKVIMNKHMESTHKGVNVFKCLMCKEVLQKKSYKQHMAKHQRELDVITFQHVCKECNKSFGSREDLLGHLLDKHRPEGYLPKTADMDNSGPEQDKEKEECQNGPSCKWFKESRCLFGHNNQSWKTVQSKRQKQLTRNNQHNSSTTAGSSRACNSSREDCRGRAGCSSRAGSSSQNRRKKNALMDQHASF